MKKTIVIVEDNQIIAGVFRPKLQAEGFNLEVTADGQSGLETNRRTQPDLVLPKMSGIENAGGAV